MKKSSFVLTLVLAVIVSLSSFAGISKETLQKFKDFYRPAVWNDGLQYAYTDPDPSKLRGFVKIVRSGIPAQRAERFINWADYDYRGVVVKGDGMKTRVGKPYTYLRPGTVMIVAAVEKFGNTIFFKLLSRDIYRPENVDPKKPVSRVSLKLGIKMPSALVKSGDFNAMQKILDSWFVTIDSGSKEFSQPVEKSSKKGKKKDKTSDTSDSTDDPYSDLSEDTY
ncbi:MAG: hypothetical protein ABIE74_11920 [Pseudomonadota bacterium]